MTLPLVLPLVSCLDPALVGGKAARLGWLLTQGFPVPPGLCMTTRAYEETLRAAGLDPAALWKTHGAPIPQEEGRSTDEVQHLIESLVLPSTLVNLFATELDRIAKDFWTGANQEGPEWWAVRSSASDEDAAEASFGGQYRSLLGVSRERLSEAIVACWASLWKPSVLAYRRSRARSASQPSMAVILQPLLAPRAAGVAYSCDPLTGLRNRVVINAVLGLGEPLVSGVATPDHFVVEIGSQALHLLDRHVAVKTTRRVATSSGLQDQPLSSEESINPALDEEEILALARLLKKVEEAPGSPGDPLDVEWALAGKRIWLLQARPIPSGGAPVVDDPTGSTSVIWSRANFQETLPDLPSPLALSYVHDFMDRNILRHYRELGCRIPLGQPSVRVLQGRPYINVTLFQSLMAQMGGDPALVTEQMGGDPTLTPPSVSPLPWWRLLLAVGRLEWRIWMAARKAPDWFAEMKRLGTTALATTASASSGQEAAAAWLDRMQAMHRQVHDKDLTFALVSGVSQALFLLGALLKRRIGPEWRGLLNETTQGLGGIISANQILWLIELADVAQQEPAVRSYLLADPWPPPDAEDFRARLAGTNFLQGLEEFLQEYGHRAIGESDCMTPRFVERPIYLLGIIRSHLHSHPGSGQNVGRGRSAQTIRQAQDVSRRQALKRIRQALGWHPLDQLWFTWWHRSLCRFLDLREANRHHLMHYFFGVRHLLLGLGHHLAARGLLDSREDLFFLTAEELEALIAGPTGSWSQDWKGVVAGRRRQREADATVVAPQTVAWGGSRQDTKPTPGIDEDSESAGILTGMPISSGIVEGPVRVLRAPADVEQVQAGDILVASVIDPGWAPLFGLAAGLIVEMGGMLSHGAIIAREYGLPTVANVRNATRRLCDGERVEVNARDGRVRRLGPFAGSRERPGEASHPTE